MRLHWRLMLLCAAAIAVAMAAVHLYVTRTVRDILMEQQRDALTTRVRTAADNLADRWEEAASTGTEGLKWDH